MANQSLLRTELSAYMQERARSNKTNDELLGTRAENSCSHTYFHVQIQQKHYRRIRYMYIHPCMRYGTTDTHLLQTCNSVEKYDYTAICGVVVRNVCIARDRRLPLRFTWILSSTGMSRSVPDFTHCLPVGWSFTLTELRELINFAHGSYAAFIGK